MALDFFAGCLGGCAGVLIGHPFDTIKVCLQTQDFRNPQYKGTFHCLTSIIRKESVTGLYKGMSSPMSGVAVVNAIVFGVYGNIQRLLPNPESYWSHTIAGTSAGFAQAFICSPMELVKTRIQLQNDSRLYTSPLDCFRQICRTEGLRGVFRGLGITIARDAPGFGTYFLAYELMTKSSVKNSPPLSTWHMLLAGGLAGTVSWVLSFPMDVLKSRLQADGMFGAPKYTGVFDCYRKSVASEGYSFLSRGLTSTILRAFPTNAACFTVVTWVFRWAGQEEAASSYQLISDFTEATHVGSLYEPVNNHIPLKVGAVLKGFDKQKQYFNQMFDWRKIFIYDAMVNCLVGTQDTKESSQIEKYVLNEESLILSNFVQILHGDPAEEVLDERIPLMAKVNEEHHDEESKEHYVAEHCIVKHCTAELCKEEHSKEERSETRHAHYAPISNCLGQIEERTNHD